MLIEWFLSIKSLPNLLFGVLCLPGDQSHPFAQPTINPLACCICWAGLLGRAVFPPWNEGPNFGSYTPTEGVSKQNSPRGGRTRSKTCSTLHFSWTQAKRILTANHSTQWEGQRYLFQIDSSGCSGGRAGGLLQPRGCADGRGGGEWSWRGFTSWVSIL